MLIFWIAIIISAISSVVVSFFVENINGLDIAWLLVFFYLSAYIIVELLKLLLGIRAIDDLRGLARYVYSSIDAPFLERNVFYRESLINVKGRYAVRAWGAFLLSFVCVGLSLYRLLFS